MKYFTIKKNTGSKDCGRLKIRTWNAEKIDIIKKGISIKY